MGAALSATGFTAIDGSGYLEIALPVRDGAHLWAWLQTHGSRAFLDDLPTARRAAFRRQLQAALAGRDRIVLRRAAQVWRGAKPG